MSVSVSMTVNGEESSAAIESRTLLVHYLREHLGLTGTHVGCDTSQCGACVVHVNGARQVLHPARGSGRRAEVLTVEGLAKGEELHPMQAAFRECHGLQCGFCTPGMLMSALDLVAHHPDPSEETVRQGLEGNICRCTGYVNIVKSVMAGAKAMRS